MATKSNPSDEFAAMADRLIGDGSIVSIGVELELPQVQIYDNDMEPMEGAQTMYEHRTPSGTNVTVTSDSADFWTTYPEFLVYNAGLLTNRLYRGRGDPLGLGHIGRILTFYSDEVANTLVTMLNKARLEKTRKIRGVQGTIDSDTDIEEYAFDEKMINPPETLICGGARLCAYPLKFRLDEGDTFTSRTMGTHMTVGIYLDKLIPFFSRFLEYQSTMKKDAGSRRGCKSWSDFYDTHFHKISRATQSANVAAAFLLLYARARTHTTTSGVVNAVNKKTVMYVPLLRNDIREIIVQMTDSERTRFITRVKASGHRQLMLNSINVSAAQFQDSTSVLQWARSLQGRTRIHGDTPCFMTTDVIHMNMSRASCDLVPISTRCNATFNSRSNRGRIIVYIELRGLGKEPEFTQSAKRDIAGCMHRLRRADINRSRVPVLSNWDLYVRHNHHRVSHIQSSNTRLAMLSVMFEDENNAILHQAAAASNSSRSVQQRPPRPTASLAPPLPPDHGLLIPPASWPRRRRVTRIQPARGSRSSSLFKPRARKN